MSGDLIDELLRLKGLYERRGPLDGRAGVTPDGDLAPAIRWSVPSVMEDASLVVGAPPDHLAAWCHAMGLDSDPRAVLSWGNPCPARRPGLTHARTARDPVGVCVHCGVQIS